MIWQFKVKNYKIFKDEAILSLIASNYDKITLADENIYIDNTFDKRILKSAVIYGANASGKSTLINAINFMRHLVIVSSRRQAGDLIDVDPFRLNVESANSPSEFEIIFSSKNTLYRYGFEVTQDEVVSEWLYYKPNTKEIELFYREDGEIEFHETLFSKGKTVVNEGLLRNNALLVSVAAQFNEGVALEVIHWFRDLRVNFNDRMSRTQNSSTKRAESPEHKKKIIALMKYADFGINDIEVEKLFESPDVLLSHKKYGANYEYIENVPFSLDKDESSGTQRYFNLLGPILDVLENGEVLIVDELDVQLHPNLVCNIISLFHSKEININNAQLIFNTHDTNLLDPKIFRRDQIWFTEKDRYGEAKLYSLSDFSSEKVRNNEDYEGNYIKGKYGAVPYFGSADVLNEALTPYKRKGAE